MLSRFFECRSFRFQFCRDLFDITSLFSDGFFAVRAIGDSLGHACEFYFLFLLKPSYQIEWCFQIFEAATEDFDFQKRFEKISCRSSFGIKWPRQSSLTHSNQFRKKFRESIGTWKAKQLAKKFGNLLIVLRAGAGIAELNHFRSAFASRSDSALDPISFAVEFESYVDLAGFCSMAKKIRPDIEVFFELWIRQKKRVAEAFDQRGLSMTVSPCDAVHTRGKCNGHSITIRSFAERFDVFQTNGVDDHSR